MGGCAQAAVWSRSHLQGCDGVLQRRAAGIALRQIMLLDIQLRAQLCLCVCCGLLGELHLGAQGLELLLRGAGGLGVLGCVGPLPIDLSLQ